MTALAILATAILLGGMTAYSFGFAALMFHLFDEKDARKALRGAFPPYYSAVIAGAALSALLALFASGLAALLLAVIAATTIYARQTLMVQINAATDSGDKGGFKHLHGLSVALQIAQLLLAGWALLLIA
ncbi:MAG: DUF4149 domain-containing protein [Shimia sp.]